MRFLGSCRWPEKLSKISDNFRVISESSEVITLVRSHYLDFSTQTKLRNNSSGEINAYPIEKRRVKDGQKWDTLEAMLKKEFPEEHEAIDKFIETIFGCSKSSLVRFSLGCFLLIDQQGIQMKSNKPSECIRFCHDHCSIFW